MWWARVRPCLAFSRANLSCKSYQQCLSSISHVHLKHQHNENRLHCRHASTGMSYYVSNEFPPIYLAQQTLESIHSLTHLPWWAVIMGVTVALRSAITLPLAVRQNKLVAKIEMLQPTLKMMSDALKHRVTVDCKRAGKSAVEFEAIYKKKHRRMMYELYKNEGCNPIKMFLLPWIQLPLWIVISLGLRNMTGTSYTQRTVNDADSAVSGALCPDMAAEGALWFDNLLIPDPIMILPLAVGLFNFTNIEIHALRRKDPTRSQRIITNSLRTVSVAVVIFASQVPTAMSLYWAVSAGYGVTQNLLMKMPTVRRQLGIPKTPNESQHPFKDLKNLASIKLQNFNEKQRRDPWSSKK